MIPYSKIFHDLVEQLKFLYKNLNVAVLAQFQSIFFFPISEKHFYEIIINFLKPQKLRQPKSKILNLKA